jgi:hypothetical protein
MPSQNIPAIPQNALDPALTALIVRTIIQITPAGQNADPVVFRTDSFEEGGTNEITPLKEPGDDGVLTTVRRDQTDREETFTFSTTQAAKVFELFGGQNKVIDCTARFWKVDPKDPSTGCRVASEEFPASIERDGSLKSGEKTHDKYSLKLTSLKTTGPVQLYWNPVFETT